MKIRPITALSLLSVSAFASSLAFAENAPPPSGADSRSAPPTTATSPSDRNPGTLGATADETPTSQSSRREKRIKRGLKPEVPHAGAPRPGGGALTNPEAAPGGLGSP